MVRPPNVISTMAIKNSLRKPSSNNKEIGKANYGIERKDLVILAVFLFE